MIGRHVVPWTLVIVMAVLIYAVTHAVNSRQRALAQLNTSIARDSEAIRVLRAEWSHLSRPDRVQGLAARYTGMRPLDASQLLTAGEWPGADTDADRPESGS